MSFDAAQRSRRSYCYSYLLPMKFIYYQTLAGALNAGHNLVLGLSIPYSNLQDLRSDLHWALDEMRCPSMKAIFYTDRSCSEPAQVILPQCISVSKLSSAQRV